MSNIFNEENDFAFSVMKTLLVVFLQIYQGYVFMTLWNWFIVTKFHLPILSLVEAYSLTILTRFSFDTLYQHSYVEAVTQQMFRSSISKHLKLDYLVESGVQAALVVAYIRATYFLTLGYFVFNYLL